MMPSQLADNCRSRHDRQGVAPGLDFQSDSFYLFVDTGKEHVIYFDIGKMSYILSSITKSIQAVNVDAYEYF